MSALTGRKRSETYTWLWHMGGPGPLTESPRAIYLGDGTELPLTLTSTALFVSGGLVLTTAAQTLTTEQKAQVVTNLGISTGGGSVDAAALASITHAATAKATPVDADEFGGADSAASFGFKKFTWAAIKATLKSYFDGIYNAIITSPGDIGAATAAQGALANSAVQPADLLTATVAQAGTATALSFGTGNEAVSMSISGSVATFTLGANAQSAFWAAIGGNSAQTIAGAKSFTAQVELTGQTAPNATSAMTRALVEAAIASKIVRHYLYQTDTQTQNSTAYKNSDYLARPLKANTTYAIDLFLIFDAPAVGFRAQLLIPSSFAAAASNMGGLIDRNGNATVSVATSTSNTVVQIAVFGAAATNGIFMGRLYVRTGSSAGDAVVQFGQNNAIDTNNPCSLKVGSTVVIDEISPLP